MSEETTEVVPAETPVETAAPAADVPMQMDVDEGQFVVGSYPSNELPTGEASSPEVPESTETVAATEVAAPTESVAQPAIDSETMRRAFDLHVNPADFGSDVVGLKRTLTYLERQVAETAARNRIEVPPAEVQQPKLLADSLKEAGHDDALVEAFRKIELDNLALRERVEVSGRTLEQQQHAERIKQFDRTVESLDPDLFGKGDAKSLPTVALQERAETFKFAARLANAYAAAGEEVPPLEELTQAAYAARHRERIANKAREEERAVYQQRQGTSLMRPAPTAPLSPSTPKYGKAAAVAGWNELVAEHPELLEAGVLPVSQ